MEGRLLRSLNPRGGMAINFPFLVPFVGTIWETSLTKNNELSHSPRLIFSSKTPRDLCRQNDLGLGNAVTTLIHNFLVALPVFVRNSRDAENKAVCNNPEQ